jgi:gliding motility-associated-like protein
LPAGSHTVSVIDGNGCTATASISVGDNRSNVTFDVLATSPNCFGETGNIAISNIVGTSPYTIEWTNGTSVSVSTNSYTIPDLGTGNYTITVTDTYGCSAIQSGNIITVPDQITLSYNEILAYIGTGISVLPTHSCTSSPSFSSSDIPSWLTLSSTTGEITGTPTSNVSGSFTVTMTCGGCDVDAVVNYTILMDLTDCYSTGTVLFREDFGGNEVGDDRCASMSDLTAMGMNILTNYVSAWNITECNYNANYQWNTGINGWDCRNHGDCQNSRGVYALVKYTLAGHPGWHGNLSDHTHSDDVSRGYMMQVDAGSTSGQFYETTIDDLCSGSELYFSVWILNVNSSSSISGLNFHIENADNGTVITDYTTSTISAHSNISDAQWERYGMSFTIPAGVTRVRLSLNNPNASTSGNDFAIDDIEIRLCVPQINIPASETELCSGQTYNVNATYLNEGTFVEPLQYQWFYSETGDPLDNSVWEAVAGQTAEDLSMANVQEANEGYYRLAISAQGNILTNCRALSEPIHLTVNPTPDAAISIVGDTEVCAGEDAVLAASPSGMSYVWSTTATTETISIHPNGQTTYTVTVTQGSCSNEASIEVGNCSCELTAEATQIDGFCTGDIVIEAEGVNGSGDYSYAWDGGQASAQIVGADVNRTYTLVVTDNSTHCTADANITTSRTGYPTIAEPMVGTILCNGGTATITLSVSNGFGEYSYEWQNSENATVGTNSNELSNITAGTYTVTVTDEHLCATSTSVTVNQPNPVVVSADKTDKVCATMGSVFVTSITGGSETGYQYQWINDANGETIGNGESVTGLAGGNYTVLVIDSNGCPGTAQVTIDDIGGTVSFSLAAHDLSCNGNGSGSIDVENITGRSPYSIVWTSTVANGNENDVMSSSYEISGLPAGNYTVIVTDADECSSTLTTTVDEPALLEATAELTAPILCHGDKFGVMVTANGGTLADGHAYSYSWHNGANTQSQNGLEEYGLYAVTVTDDNGCIAMASVNAIEPSEVQISISADEILCHGQTSTVTVTGNGGTGAYSGTGTFENVNAGTHTYTIADENGCHASDDITITEPDELGVNFNNIVEQTCETLGSVDLSIFGGQGSISYSWDGGSVNSYTSATTVSLTSGLHNVSVTDGNGCGYSQSVNIPNGSAMTVDVISNNRVYCNGMATGSFEIEFVNGTSPYAITWTNGTLTETASTHEFSPLLAGVYNVTVVDANGCSDNVSVEIEESEQLTVSASVTSVINCHDDAFDISASADGGNGGYSYLWNGNIAGQSRTALTEYTTYTVTVTDAEGCVAQASVSPENPQELYISSIVGNDIQCHNGTTVVNAYAGGGTGTLTYTWRTDGLPAVNSQQITAPAGTYGLTVTDSNGCMITTTYVIQNPDEISIQLTGTTDQYCTTLGEARLNVTGGTGNLSYSWDGNTNYTVTGNSVVSHLEAGEYTMTVTDANGCVATQTVTIEVGAEMSVVAGQPVPVLCFGDRNGSFTINMQDGMAPYTIVWNSGTFTEMSNSHEFDNLAAGSYNVTITDAHNCVSTVSVEIETPELLVASSSAEQILCHGETAEVTVSATGGTLPYQNVGIYDVTAGAYNYVVTDANGCQSTAFVSLVEPTDISVNAVSANARCYGESGSANLVVTGGTSPYSVVWQDNSNGLENNNVPVNSDFGYTVTDANGCTKTGVVRVGEPSVLSIELTASSVSCYGLANGSVSISAIGGGVPPYSYQWSNGYSSNNLVGVGAGSYSLLVTDTNGCTASSTVVVTEPALLNVDIIANNVECGVSQGSLMANTYGGNTPYSYMWSNGGISETLSGVSSGSYSLTVTDANGCMATATSQISVVGMLSASIEEVDPISCFGASDATLTVTSVYAQQPVIYQWSNGQSGPAIYGVDAGLYVVTLTDAWGCEGVASYQVNSPTELFMYSQISDAKCHNTNDGSITLNVSGGHEPYQYLWSNGSSEPNLFGIRRGVYSVVVTDSNGCVSQGNFTVNSPAPVVINAEVTDVDCYGSKNGRIEIRAEGGVEPYDYGFVNGSSVTHGRTVYDHLRPGVYRIDVKDANGCTESTSVAVAQPERLGVVAMEHAPSCKDLNDGYVELVVAGGSAPYTYTLDDYTSDSSIFTGLRSGVYNIVVTDASGCTKTVDDVVVSESYNDCIRIPNVFTPNGDGVNDEWIIENIELFPDAHIYVFNRWGQLLYHERGNGKRWDGSYRGHFVPSGVYLYIIKLHSDEDTYKGTVTVLF